MPIADRRQEVAVRQVLYRRYYKRRNERVKTITGSNPIALHLECTPRLFGVNLSGTFRSSNRPE